MTTPTLKDIRAICERICELDKAATPGKWIIHNGSDSNDLSKISLREEDHVREAGGFWIAEMVGELAEGTELDNAALIAESRNSIRQFALKTIAEMDLVEKWRKEAFSAGHERVSRQLFTCADELERAICQNFTGGRE